ADRSLERLAFDVAAAIDDLAGEAGVVAEVLLIAGDVFRVAVLDDLRPELHAARIALAAGDFEGETELEVGELFAGVGQVGDAAVLVILVDLAGDDAILDRPHALVAFP